MSHQWPFSSRRNSHSPRQWSPVLRKPTEDCQPASVSGLRTKSTSLKCSLRFFLRKDKTCLVFECSIKISSKVKGQRWHSSALDCDMMIDPSHFRTVWVQTQAQTRGEWRAFLIVHSSFTQCLQLNSQPHKHWALTVTWPGTPPHPLPPDGL